MKSEISADTSLAVRARLTHVALVAVLIALFPSLGHAGTWVPFGSETFVPGTGAPAFYVRNFGGKCLDFGPPPQVAGSPVFLYACNGTEAQQVRVEEINDRHEVILHSGNCNACDLVIGIHNPEVNPPPPPPSEFSLELQDPADSWTPAYANQVFALDGDSILLAANRNLVVQVQNARGANRTPLVAGARNLADSEFWDFNAIDGSDADPTSGFVRVATLCDLLKYIPLNSPPNPCYPNGTPSPAGPGTVVKIAQGVIINLSGLYALLIGGGVTLRGDRRGTLFGPLLLRTQGADPTQTTVMLEVSGDDVRITGLRLQGTSRDTAKHQPGSIGVYAHDDWPLGPTTTHYLRTIIDHNDISDWTENGVRVHGNDSTDIRSKCDPNDDPQTRPQDVVVARNFIHHNRMEDFGYGVESNTGGFPLVEGNTFVSNRHAIAAGYGTTHTGYRAWLNLVLFDAPLQGTFPFHFHTQDFDMHGLGTGCCVCQTCNGYGYLGGDYVDLFGNTLLGTNRHNYELRGQPCHSTDIHFNVSLHSKEDTLLFKDSNLQTGNRIEHMNISDNPNQFGFANPTDHLGVGDFDADGVQDLFLATGAAWYYSPRGVAEWRYLNGGKTDKVDSLLFGDFDGDGRTDVLGKNGNDLMVSWGGVSDWEKLNSISAPMSDLAVGDFDGDGRADIFYADGTSWFVSYSGSAPFVPVNTSSFRVKDLRFGDFDGDGKTDVFGVGNTGWQVSYSATSAWTPLPVSLTNKVDGLIVADFDGNGRADIAMSTPIISPLGVIGWNWMIWYDGATTWKSKPCSLLANPLCVPLSSAAGIGSFHGNPGADVLLWNGNDVWIASGGLGDPQRLSRQDMR